MPRMSKKRKHELSFYLNDRGRVILLGRGTGRFLLQFVQLICNELL